MSVLHCTALYCLYCTVLSVLQCTICTALHCSALHYNEQHCTMNKQMIEGHTADKAFPCEPALRYKLFRLTKPEPLQYKASALTTIPNEAETKL